MHAYVDAHGRFPPAVVYGPRGQPLYSWRVLLLPYIEQPDLYNQFHLDEPWNSPHNLPLLSRIPGTYAPPGSKKKLAPPYHTFLHVFVGKGTAFESPKGEPFDSFTNGTSNTLLVIEGGPPVPWTKPEEIPYAADQPLPPLATVFRGYVRVAMADGSMRFVFVDKEEAALRAMITRNGGEGPMPLEREKTAYPNPAGSEPEQPAMQGAGSGGAR